MMIGAFAVVSAIGLEQFGAITYCEFMKIDAKRSFSLLPRIDKHYPIYELVI